MQIVAHDVGRLSRLTAGCAGVAVAVLGAVTVPVSPQGVPPDGVLSDPAAALVPAGLALLLQVIPVAHRGAGRVVRGLSLLLTLAAAGIGIAAARRHPDAAIAILVALAVLAVVAYLVRALDQVADRQHRLVDELHDRRESVDTRRIADRKRVEDEFSSHAAELEQGNGRLREANTRLETALAFKNDLTSMLTHDVAQPISSIASLAELLRADWDDLPEDIRLELATKIDKNTQRLIKMMNDLQLLFRLDMGSVTARPAPVPLAEVASTVVAGFPAAAGAVTVEIDENLSALADRGHLNAAVHNLVANALAYGQPPVVVGAVRLGDTIELSVRDSGPGIPEDLLPNVFGRFMRGAGLGLFIVRQLIEANGGTVRYEPAEPRGARLIVTLEAAPV